MPVFNNLWPIILKILYFVLFGGWGSVDAAQEALHADEHQMEVGVAWVDIIPEEPMRLAGYGSREGESEVVLHRQEAKANNV